MTNVTEKMLVQVKERRDIAQAEKETAQLTIDTCEAYIKANCFHPPHQLTTVSDGKQYWSTEKHVWYTTWYRKCKICGHEEFLEEVEVPGWALSGGRIV